MNEEYVEQEKQKMKAKGPRTSVSAEAIHY